MTRGFLGGAFQFGTGPERSALCVDRGLETLHGGFIPGVGAFAPGVALLLEIVGEVGAAEAGVGSEVDVCLGVAVEIEDGLHAVARPLDAGDAFTLTVFERRAGVDEHGVHDGVFLRLLGAIAGVEIAGGAFVLKDGGPGDGCGVGGEKGAAGLEGERIHTRMSVEDGGREEARGWCIAALALVRTNLQIEVSVARSEGVLELERVGYTCR
jgi:hypothetical protein